MQGMNFIMASLIYHCNEEIAYFIFCALMNRNHEIRSIYSPPNMPGIIYHVNIIEQLIKFKNTEVNEFLEENLGLCTHQMYLLDWIIPLFTSVMPIDKSILFIDQFLKGGWVYFYKICLAAYTVLTPYLLNAECMEDALVILKFREFPK